MPIMMSCGVDEPDIPKLDATIMVNGTPFIISGVEVGIEDAQVGDVVIYYDNGDVEHSATINKTDGTESGTFITAKEGVKEGHVEKNISNGWHIGHSKAPYKIFRRLEDSKNNVERQENKQQTEKEKNASL